MFPDSHWRDRVTLKIKPAHVRRTEAGQIRLLRFAAQAPQFAAQLLRLNEDGVQDASPALQIPHLSFNLCFTAFNKHLPECIRW